jgi:nicotinamide mononucleotide transporter
MAAHERAGRVLVAWTITCTVEAVTTFLADWGGSVLAGASIVCLFRKSLWYWYLGLASNALWFYLFVETSTLMVAGLQVSYAIFALYGILRWRREARGQLLSLAWDHAGTALAVGVLAGTVWATSFAEWTNWVEFTAVAIAILANWLTALKVIWCWPVWILTNVLFAVLFFDQELWGLFLVQFLFAGLSLVGFREWLRERPSGLMAGASHA